MLYYIGTLTAVQYRYCRTHIPTSLRNQGRENRTESKTQFSRVATAGRIFF